MSNKPARRYNLDTIHDQFAEATGGDQVTIEVGDQEFTFPHPVFTPDDIKAQINDADGDTAVAKAVLGDQYDAFITAGGRPVDVSLLYGALFAESSDEVRGVKPRPTRR